MCERNSSNVSKGITCTGKTRDFLYLLNSSSFLFSKFLDHPNFTIDLRKLYTVQSSEFCLEGFLITSFLTTSGFVILFVFVDPKVLVIVLITTLFRYGFLVTITFVVSLLC